MPSLAARCYHPLASGPLPAHDSIEQGVASVSCGSAIVPRSSSREPPAPAAPCPMSWAKHSALGGISRPPKYPTYPT